LERWTQSRWSDGRAILDLTDGHNIFCTQAMFRPSQLDQDLCAGELYRRRSRAAEADRPYTVNALTWFRAATSWRLTPGVTKITLRDLATMMAVSKLPTNVLIDRVVWRMSTRFDSLGSRTLACAVRYGPETATEAGKCATPVEMMARSKPYGSCKRKYDDFFKSWTHKTADPRTSRTI